jgi:CheY-like chemotaxis protein
LADAGHELLEAEDGQQGLSQFRIHRPTLVITDILMPRKGGFETIRELRGTPSDVAILAMSGGGKMYLDLAKQLGADATIAKPFGAPDLVEAVNGLLTRRGFLPEHGNGVRGVPHDNSTT